MAIILNTKDPETAWNALRLGTKAIETGNSTSLFLMGSGVEIESISGGPFDVAGTLKSYLAKGGELLACGTCLKVRQQEGGVCPVSTMAQLMELITSCDKVVSLG
ncbi:DsrE family protein [Dehalogenimonas alkenigignens]|nr:DsrE family protein [Dehalogenimonas alkenigignens]